MFFKDIPYTYMYILYDEFFNSKRNYGLEHLFLSFLHKAILYRETAPMFSSFLALFPLTTPAVHMYYLVSRTPVTYCDIRLFSTFYHRHPTYFPQTLVCIYLI